MSSFAFRVDASPRIGGGHAMRCLALADALKAEEHATSFYAARMTTELAGRIERSGHRLVHLPANEHDVGADWDHAPLPRHDQRDDARAFISSLVDRPEWIVVDHYQLDAAWEQAVRPAGEKLLAIDDLADRHHDCDVLIDQNLGRTRADYERLVDPRSRLLLGPHYALLRPEFAAERPAALARRRHIGPVERILISLGTADVGGHTPRAIEATVAVFPDCTVDVVLAESVPTFAEAERLANDNAKITLHRDPPSMAILMRDADLAIGAGGSTSWERCCLGLPTAMLTLADNQRLIAQQLHDAGAAIAADGIASLPAALNMLKYRQVRSTMTASAFAICDGQGLDRAIDVLKRVDERPLDIELRLSTLEESELLWVWRNDPSTRRMAKNGEPIAWVDHSMWFKSAIADPDRLILVAQSASGPVGMVRLDLIADGDWVVSINLAPSARGRGLGVELLDQARNWALANLEARRLIAEIKSDNGPSLSTFERAGYVQTGRESGLVMLARQVSEQVTQ